MTYRPGHARIGEPTPQSNPEAFTTAEIMAEARYLVRLNMRYGSSPLRTVAYSRLLRIVAERRAALCGNCGCSEGQGGAPVRTTVRDWRTDVLCDACVASYDWSDWAFDGVATYRHK